MPDDVIQYTPAGYQGPAQHTWTAGCDGFHEPGPCPPAGPPPVILRFAPTPEEAHRDE